MNTEAHLENLAARYVEGTCGPMELAELETLLLEDAGNRKYFLDIVLLAEDLSMLDGPSQQRIGVGFRPFEILFQRQQMRTVKIALLAAAAVILISAVATWTQMAPRHESALTGFRIAPDATFVWTDAMENRKPTGEMLTMVGQRDESTVASH